MKKDQILLISLIGLLLVLLFVFGKTSVKNVLPESQDKLTNPIIPAFNINSYLQSAKQKLPVYQSEYITKLENNISRGAVNEQQINQYDQLARFWKDSVHEHEIYVFYITQSAKLVNSEKNLTFAAQQILDEFRNEHNIAKRGWKSEQAISLFEKAIELNPNNDSLKVGLGACYVFGKGMAGDAQETMKGIQQLLQVVKKDSLNLQAQLVLGIAGVISTQYNKAIERLLRIVRIQPDHLEAISWLADAYAGKGDKVNALKWYTVSKRIMNNPAYSKEVDERIKLLK